MLFKNFLAFAALSSAVCSASAGHSSFSKNSRRGLVHRRQNTLENATIADWLSANVTEATTGGFQFTSPAPIVEDPKNSTTTPSNPKSSKGPKKPKKKNPKTSSLNSTVTDSASTSATTTKSVCPTKTSKSKPTGLAISLALSSSAPEATKTKTSSATANATTSSESEAPTATSSSGKLSKDYFFGVNSYYLYSIEQSDRIQILDELKDLGATTLRIFITSIYAGNKGSNNQAANDVEHNGVGKYDDHILVMVDKLMVEASARGIKLIIALGDRYALGFWSTDSYATKYGIVSPGSSGDQRVADASPFYTSKSAINSYDARIEHILSHQNELMGNKPWSELSEAIFAFEPQNEPMGHMDQVSTDWVCDRAKTIKKLSNIPVTTGGGITTQLSLGDWAFNCDAFDIVSVHDYGTDVDSTVSALKAGQQRAFKAGKILLFEEWGAMGGNKAGTIESFATKLKANDIPFMYWEVTKPGKGAADFEVWTSEDSWWKLKEGAADKKSKRRMERRSVRHRPSRAAH
ncbi:glycoside hydrolase family 5 protein [Atractiella rhizophila]|nr:glycoside hydrolase family 5 protein [Atractiella rhizophila]